MTEGDTVSIKLATVGNAVRAQLVNAGFSFVDRIPPLEASIPIATVEQLRDLAGLLPGAQGAGLARPAARHRLRGRPATWLLRDLAVAGLWFAGAALLALVVRGRGRARRVVSGATDRLTDPVAADAARAVVSTFTDTLVRNATVVGIVLAVRLAVSGYLAARRAAGARADADA